MTVIEQLSEAQDRVLADVQNVQTRVVEANQRMAEAAANWAPKVDLPGRDSLPSFDDLPKGRELAASYFDFAGRMLEMNRAFVEQMIGVWAPAEEKTGAKRSSAKAKAS